MLNNRKRILSLVLGAITASSLISTSAFASTITGQDTSVISGVQASPYMECESRITALTSQSSKQDIIIVKQFIDSLSDNADKSVLQVKFNSYLEGILEDDVLGLENNTCLMPIDEVQELVDFLTNTQMKADLTVRIKAVPVDKKDELARKFFSNLSTNSQEIEFEETQKAVNDVSNATLKQAMQTKLDSVKIETKNLLNSMNLHNPDSIQLIQNNVTQKMVEQDVMRVEKEKTQSAYDFAKQGLDILRDCPEKTALVERLNAVKLGEIKTVEVSYSYFVDESLKVIDLYAHTTKFSNDMTEASIRADLANCVRTLKDVKLTVSDFKKVDATATTGGQVYFTFKSEDSLVTENRTIGITYAKLGDTTTANDVVYVASVPLIGDVDTRPKDDTVTVTIPKPDDTTAKGTTTTGAGATATTTGSTTTSSAVTYQENSEHHHHKTGNSDNNNSSSSSSSEATSTTGTATAQTNTTITVPIQNLQSTVAITEGMIAESKVATSADLAKVGTAVNGLKSVQTPSGKVVDVATSTKVWVKDNGSWLLYNQGEKTAGWSKVNNQWYLMNSDGVMQTGWSKNNGVWYYLNNSGVMKTGWFLDSDSNWYYLESGGAMQTGWFNDSDGSWYYLNENGSMAKDTTISGYTLGEDGRWI